MGYFGSVILLILNLLMVNFPDFFGIAGEGTIQAPIMAMHIKPAQLARLHGALGNIDR